jgi:phytoene dehydrogenase-like protein
MQRFDAIVVGAGPNGLAAAVVLAQAGLATLLVEARATVGGAASTAELTLPAFRHDLGAAVFPLGVGSPFFSRLPLQRFGLHWLHPPTPMAHPLGSGAVALERSVAQTAAGLGRDGRAYYTLMAPFVRRWEALARDALGPLRVPDHPLLLARFGLAALWPATWLARQLFREEAARALIAGLAAHATLPLEMAPASAIALTLGAAGHAVGWPFPRGGAQTIADALAGYFRALGGRIVTGWRVEHVDELPPSRLLLLDLAPRHVLALAGERLPESYRRQMARFRHGPGVFKLDWALAAPIPWRAEACRQAGTVHLGGTLDAIARAERAPWQGQHAEAPYVLLAQPSLFDTTRAPEGKHTAWAYCHVPPGSRDDMTARVEALVEAAAPGFQARILARSAMDTAAMEGWNANLVGGDITGGVSNLRQLFTRPTPSLNPYATPAPGLFLCSSSTPPGPGVHGMCGYFAARAALRSLAGNP